MDDELFRKIASLLLASAEQIALQRAVLLGVLQQAEGFDPSMLDDYSHDPTLQAKIHAEFQPRWNAIDRPETFYTALERFQQLSAAKKPN
jgi:hypothetical protein